MEFYGSSSDPLSIPKPFLLLTVAHVTQLTQPWSDLDKPLYPRSPQHRREDCWWSCSKLFLCYAAGNQKVSCDFPVKSCEQLLFRLKCIICRRLLHDMTCNSLGTSHLGSETRLSLNPPVCHLPLSSQTSRGVSLAAFSRASLMSAVYVTYKTTSPAPDCQTKSPNLA